MITKTMDKVKDHYNLAARHFDTDHVWVTMLYGSQNYLLDTEASDVDTKTMIFPTFRQVVLNEHRVSKDLTDNLGAIVTVKDYREMFQNYLKGNINFVETLYTPYFVCNPAYLNYYTELRKHRDEISEARPLKVVTMAAAMATTKYNAFDRPFAGKQEVLAQYGYDPKQLHHIVRLDCFIEDFVRTGSFDYALVPDEADRDRLMLLKTEPLPYDEAKQLRDSTMTHINNYVARAKIELLDDDTKFAKLAEWMDDFAVQIFKDVISKGGL